MTFWKGVGFLDDVTISSTLALRCVRFTF